MTEQFIAILEKGEFDSLIPFLKSLTDKQKKELTPPIKKLSKEYLEYIPTKNGNSTSFHQKASKGQSDILRIAAFFCMNRADFEKVQYAGWIMEERLLRQVIDWYVPDWFNSFVNQQAELEYIPYSLNYPWIMELAEKGALLPTKELLVKLMPSVIYHMVDRKALYQPENLLQRELTLKEHIWYLFELESNIHWSDRYLHFVEDQPKEGMDWISIFKKYSAEGKIDRFRLLKEAILASNRNFNKVLSGWFAELFIQLEPTLKEMLELQKELFSVLASSHSKPVNVVLNCLKKMITEKGVDKAAFLDQVPVLLSSGTKSIVVSTLMLLEKLAKKDSSLQPAICRLSVQVFIHPDDDLQSKAAKIVDQYRVSLDETFRAELEPYHSTILSSARALLGELFEPPAESQNERVERADLQHPPSDTLEYPEIPPVENMDDLLFLASQAFDNNQSWHIDIFPAALITWRQQLIGGNIRLLEPALQRALKMTKSEMRANQGYLDNMLAIFFIDVCIDLVRRFPKDAEALRSLFVQFDQKEGNTTRSWLGIAEDTSYTAQRVNSDKEPFYQPHQQLLLAALEKFRKEDDLPLLSTPTHQPGWLDPEWLVKRLAKYQLAGQKPAGIDLELAVSRCLPGDPDKAISLTEQLLSGEYRHLLLFLLGKEKEPMGPFNYLPAWICASLTFKEKRIYPVFDKPTYHQKPFAYYTGQFSWKSTLEENTIKQYDYKEKKDVLVDYRSKRLQVHFPEPEVQENNLLQKLKLKFASKSEGYAPFLYDYLSFKTTYISYEHNDIVRILSLVPHNPEPLLAVIMSHCLQHPNFYEEGDKKMVTATIQALYVIWDDWGNMAYVFLGTCMLSSDKTIANIAGEIWLKGVTAGKMNNELLGKAIGLQESIEFAPLKRLTDLLSQRLFNASVLHNKNLHVLVEYILKELPETPVKNLKKLLEIYAELMVANHSPIRDTLIINKLEQWKNTSGLQKVVSRLINPS